MTKITVTLVTKRLEPKFEYALTSLKEQTFPHNEFEYIIVDGYYNRRKDQVEKLIEKFKNEKGIDFPILYLPEKPSRWRGERCQICNARNTALIFANSNSKYIVNHDDCTKMPSDWLEKHLRFLEQGYLVAGSWIGYQFTIGNDEGIIGSYGPEYRSTTIKEPKEVPASWFYGQNCSYPLQAAIDINGFDEELDGEMGQEDLNFAMRLEKKGFKTIFDPTNVTGVYMNTHHYEKMIVPVNIRLKDGIYHFSNEYFTEKFLDDINTGIDRTLPIGNHFDLKELRKIVRDIGIDNVGNNIEKNIDSIYKELEKYVNPNHYDWRDNRLIEEKLKSTTC